MDNIFTVWTVAAIVIFKIVAIIHLVRCYQGKEGLADLTKFALMPLLLSVFTIFTVSNINSISLSVFLIIAALVFSFLGDVVLVFALGKAGFALGMLFFLIAHLCYISFSVLRAMRFQFPLAAGLIVAAVYVVCLLYVFLKMRKPLKNMICSAMIYAFILSVMSWFFVVAAFATPSPATISAATGSIFFLISDAMVGYRTFMGTIVKGRFFVMLTYILAQSLIIFGIMGMLG